MFVTTHYGKGFQIQFANGYMVSVQFGPGNYCTDRDMFEYEPTRTHKSRDAEIAVIDTNGEWATRRMCADLGWDNPGDDVMGYVSADSVAKVIAWACAQEVKS